jgi:hypothetical protein
MELLESHSQACALQELLKFDLDGLCVRVCVCVCVCMCVCVCVCACTSRGEGNCVELLVYACMHIGVFACAAFQ